MKLTHRIIILTAVAVLGTATLFAQSTNQNFPTPITSSELTGTIKARDVGDARLTSYYFQFDGEQGDLFINIVTRNFTGDIDVFTMKEMRPLTKIVVYADFAENETGRVIYLRKPEKMILRVQGRTPSDDPASFRIKFAGSFLASTATEPPHEPELPSVTAKNESGIRVNSVGTIVEVIPKATPVPPPPTVIAETEKPLPAKIEEERKETQAKSDIADAPEEPAKKVEVVVTDSTAAKTPPASPAGRRGARNRRGVPPKTTPADATPTESAAATPVDTAKASTTAPAGARRGRNTAPPKATEPDVDPLQNINLVILFKDGSTIQRPLSEVLRFSVDKGMLTVIGKDGTTGRYSMLEVAKVTIE